MAHQDLGADPMEPRFCEACEAGLPENGRFCGNCGRAVPEASAAEGLAVEGSAVEGSAEEQAAAGWGLERFHVTGVLGRGGSGTVYLAYDAVSGQDVALKVLDPALASSTGFLERFWTEVATMSGLEHPNVVSVLDHGETDGQAWLSMEYVQGASLRQLLAHGALSAPQALGVLSGALSGLGYLHGAGVVHGDITTGNILVDPQGVSKLADFGESIGAAGRPRGVTPAYASPESARGAELDARCDLYSLGIVLYECLAGHPPFQGSSAEVILHQQVGAAPPVIEGLHPKLQELLGAALAKDPAERPQSAPELLWCLEDAAAASEGSTWRERASLAGLATALGAELGALMAPAVGSSAASAGPHLPAVLSHPAAAAPVHPAVPAPAYPAVPASAYPAVPASAHRAVAAPLDQAVPSFPQRTARSQGLRRALNAAAAHKAATVAITSALAAAGAGAGVATATRPSPPATTPAPMIPKSPPATRQSTPAPTTTTPKAVATSLPVVACPTQQGVPQPSLSAPATLNATVTPQEAQQLEYYGDNEGITEVLAPRGWSCAAAVGADGNTEVYVYPPGGPQPQVGPARIAPTPRNQQAVTVSIIAASPFMAADMACGLFPSAAAQVGPTANGATCQSTPPAAEQITQLSPTAKEYTDPPSVSGTGTPSGGDYAAHGVMIYSDGQEAFPGAANVTCTLAPPQDSACPVVISNFLARTGA